MNDKNKSSEPSTPQPRYTLLLTLKGAFRHIADPDYREYAVEWLFSDAPICWEDLEANFPTLNRREAALHLVGRLEDRRKRILYEMIFSLHPGMKYTLNLNWPIERSPGEEPEGFLAGVEEARDEPDADEDPAEDKANLHEVPGTVVPLDTLNPSLEFVPAVALPATTPGRKRWGPFKVEPDENCCRWELGNSSMAEGRSAGIEVEWADGSVLHVRFESFLALNRADTVEVSWVASDGEKEKSEGTSVLRNTYVPVVDLTPKDSCEPQSGDRIVVRHIRRPEEGVGWNIVLTIALP